MKSKYLALLAALPLAAVSSAHAQSTFNTANDGGTWGTASNWTPAVVPNATDAEAIVNGTGPSGIEPATLALDVLLDGSYTIGKLTRSVAGAAATFPTSPTTYDPTKGLTLATSTGTPTISVLGDVFYYAAIFGTQGFEKTGAGKLTFRFNPIDQTYTGDITITSGTLGINQNSSLGDDENDISIAGGARLFAEPGSNSGTITLPDTRTITLRGLQSQIGSNNAAVNLVIEGEVTQNAPGNGLVKTDAGKVTLAGTLGYTGETRINAGTLALSGDAALPTSPSQNLRFTGNATACTLDLGGTSQTVRTIVMDQVNANRTITGGGNLTINGDANLTLSSINGVTYNFSGIDSFTYDRSNRNLNFQTTNVAAVTTINDFNLAKSGINGGTNSITAAAFQVGGSAVSDGTDGNTARLHLGTTNTVNADTIKIGAFNAGGVVDFQSGLTAPSLTLRATDGLSAVTTLAVGETSSGGRHGDGTLNLTGGSLDAVVTNLQLGRHTAGINIINNTASLTMPEGTLEVDTLLMAEKTGGGTPTLTATFTQGGGDVTIDTLTMGAGNGTEAAVLLPTYRLWGGTLAATTIQSGGGVFATTSSRNLILRDGILINQSGADLSISGVTMVVSGVTTTVVDSTAGQKVVLASDVTYSARINSFNGTSGALTVDGDLDLTAQPAFGIFDDASTVATQLAPGTKLTLIDYSLGSLTGTFAGLPEGSPVNVTKGAVTNSFVIKYADDGGTAVTLTIPAAGGDNFDTWATANGIDGEPFDGDFDNDGIINGVEYALGLNPTTSSQPAGVLSGNTITFTKGADAITNGDVSWIIETSTTLAANSWIEEITHPGGEDNGTTIAYTFTPGTPEKKFARLKVVKVP